MEVKREYHDTGLPPGKPEAPSQPVDFNSSPREPRSPTKMSQLGKDKDSFGVSHSCINYSSSDVIGLKYQVPCMLSFAKGGFPAVNYL
jgi:hypothetical protein